MKLYGLIGYPLDHSFSKKYFDKKFDEEGIPDIRFELFPLKQAEEVVTLFENPELSGLAVTIPYKESVVPFIDSLSDEAWEMNTVNCISFAKGKTTGHNTDITGFELSFMPLVLPVHRKALVLGAGGSSKAVQYILRKNKIGFLIVSRKELSGENVITYEDIDEDMMQEYNIIINCTPVGMTPDEESQPAIPYHFLTKDHLLYDLIYTPELTKFLQHGQKRGCTVKNGFQMLIIQAEENWKIWNNH